MNLADHPSVKAFHAQAAARPTGVNTTTLAADRLRTLAINAGADDAGLVSIDHPAVADQRARIGEFFPPTRTLLAFVCRMNRHAMRCPARSLTNLESKLVNDRVHRVGQEIANQLGRQGVAALNTTMAFPVEMDRIPNAAWAVSHKPVALAAGLGAMGLNRSVIHPQFGDCILLGTVLVGAAASGYGKPLDYNPCLDCKLCSQVCPTGAISPDGHFDFASCMTHNYREFFGGFTDWVETLANSRNALAHRRKMSETETATMWQSLMGGGTYRCAFCQGICPAGQEAIGDYLADRAAYVRDVMIPLRDKAETVHVVPGSDAEAYVSQHLTRKRIKRVGIGIRPRTVAAFLTALPLIFQRGRSKGLNATYHFTFTGAEPRQVTVIIRDQILTVSHGHTGTPDIRVTTDSQWWIGFLAKERNLIWGLVSRKLKIKGPPRLMSAFSRCFPL